MGLQVILTYCHFLTVSGGKAVFFFYLSGLTGMYGSSIRRVSQTLEFLMYATSFFYLIMAILFCVFQCCGEQKAQAQMDKLSDKIASDD